MSAAQETRAEGIDTDVAALRRLDPDRAFERLYRRHASDVYRYALAVVRDAGDAEDVTQTTFLNAFRAFQRGERPVKPKSWLIAIAHNVCLQRFRNASRRPHQVAFDEEVAEAVVPEESPSVEDLLRALDQLSFNQRSALVMRELEGRSYKEIGELLSLPVSAVETLLFRARRALREQLETSITCEEAEELLSRQLDGRLPRGDRGALRAHLRACEECAHTARSQRAQRSAWKSLSFVPLPASLSSLFGGGGGAVATGMAAKAAAVGVAVVLVGGGTYEGARVVSTHARSHVQAPKTQPAGSAPRRRDLPLASSPVNVPTSHPELATRLKRHQPHPRRIGKGVPGRASGAADLHRARGKSSAPGQLKKAALPIQPRHASTAASAPSQTRPKKHHARAHAGKVSPPAHTVPAHAVKAHAHGATGSASKPTVSAERTAGQGSTFERPAAHGHDSYPRDVAKKR